MLHDADLPTELLPSVLNAAAVGLVANHSSVQTADASDSSQQPAVQEASNCVGVGIVRAVDLKARAVFLLTNVPLERLRQARSSAVSYA